MIVGVNAMSLADPRVRGWTRYAVNLLRELLKLGVGLRLYARTPLNPAYLRELGPGDCEVRVAPPMRYALWEQGWQRELTLIDGGMRIIEVNLLPHINALGKPTAAFVLIHDITKHRLAEQAIRDSEERLLKFADATNEAIVFFENGIVTDMNAAAARLIRLPLESSSVAPCFIIIIILASFI